MHIFAMQNIQLNHNNWKLFFDCIGSVYVLQQFCLFTFEQKSTLEWIKSINSLWKHISSKPSLIPFYLWLFV